MEIRQLRYFVAVAATESFTRGAERCNVAQPSLSQQIATLEDELGDRLFHRKPRSVSLSEAGQLLYPHAIEVLRRAEEIERIFAKRRSELTGVLRLGVIPTVAPYLLPRVLEQFRKDYPRVRLEITEAQTEVLLGLLKQEEVDLVIVSDLDSKDLQGSLQLDRLYDEKLYLAVPVSHSLRSEKTHTVQISHISSEEVMHLKAGHCLRDRTVTICPPNASDATIECEQISTLASLVQQKFGIAFVPQTSLPYLPRKGMKYLTLDPEQTRSVNLLYKGGVNSPIMVAFQKCLHKVDIDAPPFEEEW